MKLQSFSAFLRIFLLIGTLISVYFVTENVTAVRLYRGRPVGPYGLMGNLLVNLKKFKTGSPDPVIPEQWFDGQLLDHFSFRSKSDTPTWRQRYFVNIENVDKSSTKTPIFLWLSGEGSASPWWLIKGNGQMSKNAIIYKAALVSLEHRYYGKSHPTR